MTINICALCMENDFGYCRLRNSEEIVEYKKNEEGELIKCSGFCADISAIRRKFKLEIDKLAGSKLVDLEEKGNGT